MLIVTIRTDKPEAEIGLYEDAKQLDYLAWQAHRELAETMHLKLRDLLAAHGKQLADMQGIVFFKGPGSFTGLRIGASVANALAYGFSCPIIGSSGGNGGEGWIEQGVESLLAGKSDKVVLPEYGAAPHITTPSK